MKRSTGDGVSGGAAGHGGSGSGVGSPRILVVCRANVRRSPAVVALLSHARLDGFTVVSAGTTALVGDGMDSAMVAELRERGVVVSDHRARLLTPREIERADLILTLERSQRSEVVRMVPAAVRRTFTLRELAALITLTGPGVISGSTASDRLASLLAEVPAQRALRQRREIAADDVADLRKATPRATRDLVSALASALAPLIEVLAQPTSAERNSPHHLRSAAANASVQHSSKAR